jgi:hypothetical protein
MKDEFRVCGLAQLEMERLEAGHGDPKRGDLVLAQRRLKKLWFFQRAEIADALFEVGRAHHWLDQREKGDVYLARALKIWRKSKSPPAGKIGEIAAFSDPADAEPLWKWAIELAGIDESCKYYRSQYAELLDKQGRTAEAEEQRQAIARGR